METDEICKLVEEAHEIFNAYSIHEVIDLDRKAATDVLNELYGDPGRVSIDRYLGIVERLNQETQAP